MPGPALVCSYNEWDPLEELIIGSVKNAHHIAYEPALGAYYPFEPKARAFSGEPFTFDEIAAAEIELDLFAATLSRRGIVVRRPDEIEYSKGYSTPDFTVSCGHCHACPRDVLLIVGNEIIEAPMAHRGRFFEYRAYRRLIKDYFRNGAKWTTAPKPHMSDELYIDDYTTECDAFDVHSHPAITEFEPCFDAACFTRMGRDIFWQPDLASNTFGAQWLKRHLGEGFRIHTIEFHDRTPQHIDTSLVPLRPGLVLHNPERPCKNGMLSLFVENGWEILYPPPSVRAGLPAAARDVSNWISLNILSLDDHTVVIEEAEEPMARFLENLGFSVIACPFSNVYKFGGSFHCCSSDIRRRGTLQSYFPSLDK